MSDTLQRILCSLLVEHGRVLCSEPRRLRALLRDQLGREADAYPWQLNVLILTSEASVAKELLFSQASGVPLEATQRRIAARLQRDLAMNQEAALWAVQTWTAALGMSSTEAVPARTLYSSKPETSAPQPLLPTGNAIHSKPMDVPGAPPAAPATQPGRGASTTVLTGQTTPVSPPARKPRRRWRRLLLAAFLALAVAGGGLAVRFPELAQDLVAKARDMAASLRSQPSQPATTASAPEVPKPSPSPKDESPSVPKLRARPLLLEGRFVDALADCEQALRLLPESAGASARAEILVVQAQALEGLRRHPEAVRACDEALKLVPDLTEAFLTRARAHLALRAWDQALADCTQAITRDPNNAASYRLRAHVSIRRNEYERAVADCTQALRLDARDTEAYLLRARVHNACWAFDRALADCTAAAQIDSRKAAVFRERAAARKGSGQLEEALEDYKEALRLDSSDVAALVGRGETYAARHDKERARADYDAAVALLSSPEDAVSRSLRAAARLGLARLGGGDYAQVIGDCNAALLHDPTLTAALVCRAQAYRATGDLTRSITDCTTAIRLNPKDASAYQHRGAAHYQSGADDRAIADCTTAIHLHSPYEKAYAYRAEAYARQGSFDRALADCNEALRLDPQDAAALRCRAFLHCRQHACDKAITDCTEALRFELEDAATLAVRAYAFWDKGAYSTALQDCKRALHIVPHLAFAHAIQGGIRARIEEYAQAAADCTEAIRRDPKLALAYAFRGEARADQGDLDKALADCDEAIRLDPRLDVAYRSRGYVYGKKGEYDKAISDCTRAIRLSPNYAGAWKLRAWYRFAKKDHDLALTDYQEALRLRPEDVSSLLGLGDILSLRARYDEAITEYEKAIRLAPEASTFNRRGSAYQAKRNYQRAIRDYGEAIRLQPRNALFWSNRADSYRLQGDYARAVEDYTEVLRLSPKDAVAWRSRGLAHEGLKEDAGAVADYTEALQLVPRDAATLAARGRARNRLKKWTESVQDFTRAIELTPQDAELYVGRSYAYIGLDELDKAIADCNEALRLDPKNTAATDNRTVARDVKAKRLQDELARRSRPLPQGSAERLPLEMEKPPRTCKNQLGMELVLLPAGTFRMGSSEEEDAKPHTVEITQPFYMARYPVTVKQFRAFVNDNKNYRTEAETDGEGGFGYTGKGNFPFAQDPKFSWRNPGFKQGDSHPVVNVTWKDAQEFCKWLSRTEGMTYRLPSEAQWEYACRAGTRTRYYCGDDVDDLPSVANLADQSLKRSFPLLKTLSWNDGYPFTAPVDEPRFRENAFGLAGMHGNVWQWCADWYGEDYYQSSPRRDPQGPRMGEERVMRGGSFMTNVAAQCRSAKRDKSEPGTRFMELGFRVTGVLPPALRVGDQVPFVVADFLAGLDSGEEGCPFVLVNNSGLPGVVILAREGEATRRAIDLAKALDEKVGQRKGQRGFVLACDVDREKATDLAKEAGLERFTTGVNRGGGSGKELFGRLGFAKWSLVVIAVEGKKMKGIWGLGLSGQWEYEAGRAFILAEVRKNISVQAPETGYFPMTPEERRRMIEGKGK